MSTTAWTLTSWPPARPRRPHRHPRRCTIEETQHAHGLPLVVLGRLVCKGGEPTPVLGCPICALITAWVATVKPVLAKQAQAQPVGDTQTETQAQKRKRPSRGTESAAGSETATL